MPDRIWNYYKEIARIIGHDAEGEELPYSVSWFYEGIDQDDSLNRLSRAFLGDETAMNDIVVSSEGELREMRSRVKEACGGSPNPSQIDAVANAILNDITIIQGPPGTGKTATIKNIVLALSCIRPNAKIAIVSANGEAIDNAEDELKKEESLLSRYARLGRVKLRRDFKKSLKSSDPEFYRRLRDCDKESNWKYPPVLLEKYPVIFSTIHSLRKCVDIDEYDYVIVDECSQVPSVIGMLAMNTAKHLVLLGDDEQLPPIHHNMDIVIDGIGEIRSETPWWVDEGDNSFMKACKKAFGNKCRSILLNEHYRCHPAIIGFCNKYVYHDQLIVRTEDDGKLPIRVRWYEGDYWERIPIEEKSFRNYNRKAIEVFVRDEYPIIIQKLRENPGYSVCVLSPYRAQLEELRSRLEGIRDTNVGVELENTIEQSEEGVNDIPQLTIHKAQGRGFDLVYIMPVEDVGGNPWSQRKEIINVAVSRAKKELCVITSAAWMPQDMQNELLGYHTGEGYEEEGKYYIAKLLKYVRDAIGGRDPGNEYGFKKTSISSIFDKTLYYRKQNQLKEGSQGQDRRVSAPELCLRNALKECREINDNYNIRTEVWLKDIKEIKAENEEVKRYIDRGAKFDVVISQNKKICAILEIDGSYHRFDPKTIENDRLKEAAVASIGEGYVENRFIRLPTDGTTESEMNIIKNIEKTLDSIRKSNQ